MRRTAILLVLLVTANGCVCPRTLRATVRSGVRDVAVAVAIVVVVAEAAHYIVERSLQKRARRAQAPRSDAEQSVESRWADARRRR